jgi:prolyl 4-hydroxylase
MCQACDSLIVDSQCRRDPNGVDAWGPGGAYRMFERILVEHAQYDVRVLSRPYYAPGDTAETATYKLGPWIITLENFLSDEEADHMVALGETEGYVKTAYRTEEQEADEEFINNLQHTAAVVYCQSQNCYYDPIHQRILERMSNITFLPKANHEFFQMIRYNEGQWFKTHNDFAPHHALKAAGVRLTTFLVYHSHVEEGGATSFDELNLTVQPKKGRAVIFSCVLNEDPNRRDNLMDHEALKVIKGTKYGTSPDLRVQVNDPIKLSAHAMYLIRKILAFNTHAHQRDYQTPYSHGCGV